MNYIQQQHRWLHTIGYFLRNKQKTQTMCISLEDLTSYIAKEH